MTLPKTQPAAVPHGCVVLAVDTAQVSGWFVGARGAYVRSGEFDVLRYPQLVGEVCSIALELGKLNALPVVLVYEKPFLGTSQGQYIGAWKAAWAAAGGVKSRTVGVYPSQWRARVLAGGWARAPRDQVRRMEAQVAAQVAGRIVEPDEAAAVCISEWAARAPEVLAKLPASARKEAT